MAARKRQPRRRDRRAARRAAFHTERMQRAASPAERLQAAAAYLVSAVTHGAHPARSARSLTSDITGHARRGMDRVELTGAARALHEAKLSAGATEVARMSSALMVLRSVIDLLPEVERDRACEHYANELAAEAARIPRK